MTLRTYFARHAQTLVGSLGRLVQQPIATFMTMAVIGVALALPLLLNVVVINARAASGGFTEAFELSVYLAKPLADKRAEALAGQLKKRRDVAAVRIITADQALAAFRTDSGFGRALDALGENPLPDTLVITPTLTASTPEGTEALRAAIAALPEVQNVQLDTAWVKRLHALLELARRCVQIIGALLGLGIVLIVSNTIRLDIENRRAEVEVMKLVGASDGFTRRPFLYTGIWYGLGGGALALLLVAVGMTLLMKPVERLAVLYGSGYRLHGFPAATGAATFLLAVLLAWIGSWIAVWRHIRAIEPL